MLICISSEDAPAETVSAVTEPVVAPEPATETPAESAVEAKLESKQKRSSIFGSLKAEFFPPKTTKKSEASETAPAVPAKDATPVSEDAPVIPQIDSSEPVCLVNLHNHEFSNRLHMQAVAAPATEPTEETAVAPATNGAPAAAETPVQKRKGSLPFGLGTKKEKVVSSDEENEKPKSPFAKVRWRISII